MGLDGLAAVGAFVERSFYSPSMGNDCGGWSASRAHDRGSARYPMRRVSTGSRPMRWCFIRTQAPSVWLAHRAQNLLIAGEAEMAADVVLGFVEVAWARCRDEAAIRADARCSKASSRGYCSRRVLLAGRPRVERLAGQLVASYARRSCGAMASWRSTMAKGAASLRLLAQLASDQGQAGAAADYAEQAYAMFVAVGHDGGRAACEMVLGQCEALGGNHRAACTRFSNAAASAQAASPPRADRSRAVFAIVGAV
ncbi:MAG: hypothetical protein U0165_01440 [Polyangiaceae bacterium]